jgi:hypothetical protein
VGFIDRCEAGTTIDPDGFDGGCGVDPWDASSGADPWEGATPIDPNG